MKIYNLREDVLKIISSPNVLSLLQNIEMYKGKTLSVSKLKKIETLVAIARQRNIVSSNALGNVFISAEREKQLFEKGVAPETFEDHMIMGYGKALDLIDEVYKYQPFDRSFITTLHYYIYKDYNPELGGRLKDSQNYVHEFLKDGTYRTLLVPAAPEETIQLLDNLIYQFNLCAQDDEINKLVLIFAFLLDFLCIHPFNHGNGRMSRLILTFLLKKYGYDVDTYYPLAMLLNLRISEYAKALETSANGWRDDYNDYSAYVSFMLRIVLEAYRKLDYIIQVNTEENSSVDKVYKVISDSATPVGKMVIDDILYSVSPNTIEKSLGALLKEQKIQLITKGRYSKYFRR